MDKDERYALIPVGYAPYFGANALPELSDLWQRALSKLPVEHREAAAQIPLRLVLRGSAESQCIYGAGNNREIVMDIGLPEILLQYDLAIVSLIFGASEDLVIPRILSSAIAYVTNSVDPFNRISKASMDQIEAYFKTSNAVQLVNDLWRAQLQFILAHEVGHICQLDNVSSEEVQCTGDNDSESWADRYASLAIGQYWGSDHAQGTQDLAAVACFINFLSLCEDLSKSIQDGGSVFSNVPVTARAWHIPSAARQKEVEYALRAIWESGNKTESELEPMIEKFLLLAEISQDLCVKALQTGTMTYEQVLKLVGEEFLQKSAEKRRSLVNKVPHTPKFGLPQTFKSHHI